MHFSKVTYLAAFPHPELGTFAPLKLGLEIDLNEGDTVEMALNAAKEKLDTWNKEMNKSIWSNPEGMTGTHTRSIENSKETDEAYEKLIVELDKIEFREDAQVYLDTTEFKFTMSAKARVINKPLKNI